MCKNITRVDFTLLDETEKVIPVFVHGGLAIGDEPNAELHECTDIEVIHLNI